MTQILKHPSSKALLTLYVAFSLVIGIVACTWLSSCGSSADTQASAPASQSTSSTSGAEETDSEQEVVRPEANAGSEANAGPESSQPTTNKEASSADEGADKSNSADKPSKNASFTCTFLDVGQGDCSIIHCDGHYMIIDGGAPSASRTIYSYLQRNQISHFDYLVATHDDADHISGLSGALRFASVDNAYCSVTSSSKDAFQDLQSSLATYNVKLQRPKAGKTFKLGRAHVQVIAPAHADTKDNDDSLVLRVTLGKTSALFTGDAGEIEEDELLSSDFDLKSDLLKVAHHGSASSSSARFLRAVSPAFAVISVGKDNAYGHPTSEALARLKDCGAKLYRTDLQGTITATSDGKTFTMKTQKKAKTPVGVSQSDQRAKENKGAEESQYIGNTNSLKFHRPDCRTLPQEHNRAYFKSRKEAVDAGYSPCGNCQP